MIVEPGAVIGGKYKLEQKLAVGGMGSVWLARHLQLQIDVAVKLLDASAAGSADAHARFEREAKALSKLRHPNVVQVHDFGLEGDMPYLVMELLRGESLEARLKRDKRIPVPSVKAMLSQVAKGLRRAHEAGFVHRDLKPGNLFIVKADDEETFGKSPCWRTKASSPAPWPAWPTRSSKATGAPATWCWWACRPGAYTSPAGSAP